MATKIMLELEEEEARVLYNDLIQMCNLRHNQLQAMSRADYKPGQVSYKVRDECQQWVDKLYGIKEKLRVLREIAEELTDGD